VRTSPGALVVYQGRLDVDLPDVDGLRVFDEWSLLPQRLGELERAEQVVVLDPMSFPIESLSQRAWEAPLAVAVPQGLSLDDLSAALGMALFDRLTYHDLLIVGDDELWSALVRRHGFAVPQRLDFAPDGWGSAVGWLIENGELMPEVADGVAPRRRDRSTKAAFVLEAGAVAPSLAELELRTPEGMQPSGLVVGCGGGDWLRAFLARGFTVDGFDRQESLVEEAAVNYPQVEVKHLDPGLRLGVGIECYDVALGVWALGGLQRVEQVRLLREMWEAVRPGGMLVVLDRFVPDGDAGWLPVQRLMEVVSEASADHVVLEDVQSRRGPGRTEHQFAAVTFVKIGPPERAL
jgi:SAM-dependent methyltransferase